MSRLNREQLTAAIAEQFSATPDPTGEVDLVSEKGRVIVAAEVDDLKDAFKRIKKVDGYRWVAINRDDLFAANTLSLGSKAGMVDGSGKVLKAPDVPRKKI
jgi:hypothetical protein